MSGKRVIVTGTKDDATAFSLRLIERGFDAVPFPTIRITKKKLSTASLEALKDIASYDYLLFTSVRAVELFADILRDQWIKKPRDIQVVAVGTATARACHAIGYTARIVPKSFSAREAIETMDAVDGKKILFPSSAITSSETKAMLESRGAIVTAIHLYTTSAFKHDEQAASKIVGIPADFIIFMSPSSVQAFIEFVKSLGGTILSKKVLMTQVLAIGPTTCAAAVALGFETVTVARPSTVDGILKTLQKISQSS